MDNWTTFPDLFEQFLTDQQPPAYPFGHPLSHGFDGDNELASHDFISAQQATNLFEPLNPLSLSQEHIVPVPQNTGIISTNDAELTAAAMGPPPKGRKNKAPTLRAKDWEPYKARILELHDAQKLPLTKVKEMIEEEFGFSPELRQYRTRITQWGKDKNIKPAEMSAIVRKRQQRKLVEVDKREQIFSVRGRNVETHKIDRWMVRHEVSQTSLYAPSPVASTPSAISYRTISERGSVAPSPVYSTRSLGFSPRTRSIILSPATYSPLAFMPGMGHPQSSAFDIRGQAYIYQPSIPLMDQSSASNVIPLDQPPRRYKQVEEEGVREALSVAENSFGAYHSQTLELRIRLGDILIEQGRYKHAEEIARKTVEDCENNENALIIKFHSLQLLSNVLHVRGSYHRSQKLQEWLFEWGKVNLGKEHPSVVYCMIRLSSNYVGHGNIEKGEELGAQTLKISKEIFGESHHETMHAMYTLVLAYIEQGRLNEAEELGLQLLTKTMTMLGDRHPTTIGCMSRLALVYSKQGRSNEAGELLRQALEMSMHLFGEDHPAAIDNRYELSKQYKTQGRLEEAKDLGEQALTAAQRALDNQHPRAIKCMALLVKIYKDQGQIAKAEELEQQKQELKRRMLERQKEDMGLPFSFPNMIQTSGF